MAYLPYLLIYLWNQTFFFKINNILTITPITLWVIENLKKKIKVRKYKNTWMGRVYKLCGQRRRGGLKYHKFYPCKVGIFCHSNIL